MARVGSRWRCSGDRRYRLLASPTLARGTAADDEIALDDDGNYVVVRRGGNVAVHVEMTEKLDDSDLVARVHELGVGPSKVVPREGFQPL